MIHLCQLLKLFQTKHDYFKQTDQAFIELSKYELIQQLSRFKGMESSSHLMYEQLIQEYHKDSLKVVFRMARFEYQVEFVDYFQLECQDGLSLRQFNVLLSNMVQQIYSKLDYRRLESVMEQFQKQCSRTNVLDRYDKVVFELNQFFVGSTLESKVFMDYFQLESIMIAQMNQNNHELKLQFSRDNQNQNKLLEMYDEQIRQMETDQLIVQDGHYVYKYMNCGKQEVIVFRIDDNQQINSLDGIVDIKHSVVKYLAKIFQQFYLNYVVKYIKVNQSNFSNFNEVYNYYNKYLILNQSLELLNLAILLGQNAKLEFNLDGKSDSEIMQMNLMLQKQILDDDDIVLIKKELKKELKTRESQFSYRYNKTNRLVYSGTYQSQFIFDESRQLVNIYNYRLNLPHIFDNKEIFKKYMNLVTISRNMQVDQIFSDLVSDFYKNNVNKSGQNNCIQLNGYNVQVFEDSSSNGMNVIQISQIAQTPNVSNENLRIRKSMMVFENLKNSITNTEDSYILNQYLDMSMQSEHVSKSEENKTGTSQSLESVKINQSMFKRKTNQLTSLVSQMNGSIITQQVQEIDESESESDSDSESSSQLSASNENQQMNDEVSHSEQNTTSIQDKSVGKIISIKHIVKKSGDQQNEIDDYQYSSLTKLDKGSKRNKFRSSTSIQKVDEHSDCEDIQEDEENEDVEDIEHVEDIEQNQMEDNQHDQVQQNDEQDQIKDVQQVCIDDTQQQRVEDSSQIRVQSIEDNDDQEMQQNSEDIQTNKSNQIDKQIQEQKNEIELQRQISSFSEQKINKMQSKQSQVPRKNKSITFSSQNTFIFGANLAAQESKEQIINDLVSKQKNPNKFDMQIHSMQYYEKYRQQVEPFELNLFDRSCEQQAEIATSHMLYNKHRNYFEFYKIDFKIWNRFLSKLILKYNKRDNPFHNFMHGVQVMHGCYQLTTIQKLERMLNDLQKFAMIFSGLCHDVDHRARTNIFEKNAESKIALVYNDQSILENHHSYVTFKLINKCELFKNCPMDYRQFRNIVIQLILATDMSKHFQQIEQFIQIKEQSEIKYDEKTVQTILNTLIHTADYSGNVQQFEISKVWSQLINEEFISQFNEELDKQIPVTSFYKGLDYLQYFAKNEIGFINFIVLPLYKLVDEFLETGLKVAVQNIEDNLEQWKQLKEIKDENPYKIYTYDEVNIAQKTLTNDNEQKKELQKKKTVGSINKKQQFSRCQSFRY